MNDNMSDNEYYINMICGNIACGDGDYNSALYHFIEAWKVRPKDSAVIENILLALKKDLYRGSKIPYSERKQICKQIIEYYTNNGPYIDISDSFEYSTMLDSIAEVAKEYPENERVLSEYSVLYTNIFYCEDGCYNEKYFNEITRCIPDNSLSYEIFGNYLSILDIFERDRALTRAADEFYEKAIILDVNNHKMLFCSGILKYYMNQHLEAYNYLDQYYKITNDKQAFIPLANACYKIGRIDEALEYYSLSGLEYNEEEINSDMLKEYLSCVLCDAKWYIECLYKDMPQHETVKMLFKIIEDDKMKTSPEEFVENQSDRMVDAEDSEDIQF